MTEKHAAEVLADECDRSAEGWLSEVETRRRAAAMLRTIPALEAECDALRENYEYVLGHCREAQTLAMERVRLDDGLWHCLRTQM